MSNVIRLSSVRPPVLYSIHISSGYDGVLEATIDGIGQDERSKEALIWDLEYLIKLLKTDGEDTD